VRERDCVYEREGGGEMEKTKQNIMEIRNRRTRSTWLAGLIDS
jgi:hypothetical protein